MTVRHVTHEYGLSEVSGGPNTRVEPVIYCDEPTTSSRALWDVPSDFHNVFPHDLRRPVLAGTPEAVAVAAEVQIVPPNEEIGEQ